MGNIFLTRWVRIPAALLAVVLCTLSCMVRMETEPLDSEVQASGGSVFSFTAVLDSDPTRTLLDGLDVHWTEGDRIRVFTASCPAGQVYALTAGAGTSTGVFSGPDPGDGPFHAIYPAEAGALLDGGSLHVTLPSVQTYAPGSFGAGANLSAGYAPSLEKICLHNLGGTLALRLSGEKRIRSIRVCTLGSESLCGKAVVSGLETGDPTLRFEASQTDPSCRQVVLDAGAGGVSLSPSGTAFYLVLPAGSLTGGFFLEATDSDGYGMVRHARPDASSTIVRGEIRPMPELTYEPRYKADFLQPSAVGAYAQAGSATEALSPLCRYEEGRSQYAYLNTPGQDGSRYLRIQDWEAGFALGFTMPYELSPGQDYSVDIQSLGLTQLSSGTVTGMRMVKRFGARVWLYDSQTGNGYVLLWIDNEEE